MGKFLAVARGPNHRWWAFGTVALGTLMATLDSSIVNISLPTILGYFHSDLETVQWVVLAYLLTITSLLLPFGRLSDIWGRKRIYTIGFILFTVASLACGFSVSVEQLVVSRVVQAIGAAMVQANSLAITNAVFPNRERGRALGMNGAVVATGTTLGPVLGGLIVNTFGWQAIFRINLPIGLIGIAMAFLVLEEERISVQRAGASARFDVPGAVLISSALVTLLISLNRGEKFGWSSPLILGLFATAALLFISFIVVELRVPVPLLNLQIFRVRAFASGSLASLCSFLAISANVFLMPFYLQLVLGYSPSQAGLMLTPTSLTLAVTAPIGGYLADRFGARVLSSIGLTISCIALVLLSQLPANAHYIDVVFRLIMLGVGSGIFNSPNTTEIFSSVPRERYGVTGGFLSMMRNSGQVIGQAVAGALVVSAIAPVVSSGGLDALRTSVKSAADHAPLLLAFMSGLRHAYLVSACLAFCGVLASLSRGRRPGAMNEAGQPTTRPLPEKHPAD